MCFAPQLRALFRHRNSQKWSEPGVFVHFDLEMCFAPQRLALFGQLNFQQWSDVGVFCAFWVRNVLLATTAWNFWSFIWPAGSAPAALARLLFKPPEPQIIGKNTVNRGFLTFSRTRLFLLLTLFFLWSFHFLTSTLWLFPPLLFHLSICRKFDF